MIYLKKANLEDAKKEYELTQKIPTSTNTSPSKLQQLKVTNPYHDTAQRIINPIPLPDLYAIMKT